MAETVVVVSKPTFKTPHVWGHVIATLGIDNPENAKLLLRAVEGELRNCRNDAERAQLETWRSHLRSLPNRAAKLEWRGW